MFSVPGTVYLDKNGKPRDKYGLPVHQDNTTKLGKDDLLKAIKKCQRRIDRLKHFVNVPLNRENDLVRKMRAKIIKEESILNRHLFTLGFYDAERQGIDQRELTKHQNSQDEMQGRIVRLDNGKIRNKKETQIPESKIQVKPTYTPEEIKLREAKIAADRLFNKMYKKR